MLDDDGLAGATAGLFKIFPGRVPVDVKQRVVVVGANNAIRETRVVLAGLVYRLDKLIESIHVAKWVAAKENLKEVDCSLLRVMAVAINEAWQHGFAVQIDNVGSVCFRVALCLGVFRGTGEDDFAVIDSNHFDRDGVVGIEIFDLCEICGAVVLEQVGHRVDRAALIQGVKCRCRSISRSKSTQQQQQRRNCSNELPLVNHVRPPVTVSKSGDGGTDLCGTKKYQPGDFCEKFIILFPKGGGMSRNFFRFSGFAGPTSGLATVLRIVVRHLPGRTTQAALGQGPREFCDPHRDDKPVRTRLHTG